MTIDSRKGESKKAVQGAEKPIKMQGGKKGNGK